MQFLGRICAAVIFAGIFIVPCYAQGGDVLNMMAAGDMTGAKNGLEALLLSGQKSAAEEIFFFTFDHQEMTDALINILTQVYQDASFDVTTLSWIYGDIYNQNRAALDNILSNVIMQLCKQKTPSKGLSDAIIFAFTSRAALLYGSSHLKEPIEESLELAIQGLGYDMVCPMVVAAVDQSGGMAFLLKMQLKKTPVLVDCVANV